MKPILFFITVLITSVNCFSQSENIERTKQIATIERKNFAALHHNTNLSLASNNFQVYYYRCKWNIDPAVRYISGSVTSYFKITASAAQITYDLATAVTVDSIIFRKKRATFSQANDMLVISFPAALAKAKKDSVTIYYHGVPPDTGDFTGGFTQTDHSGTPVIWTLSEPYGASSWWPCRDGLDDKADSIDIYITHPSQYKASSNGILVSTITNGSNTTSYYKHRYPIASYLVGISVTNYSIITNNITIHGKKMPVIQYAYPESLSSFQAGTTVVLKALLLYSNYFGDYPFINERYGQTQFSWGGGMEHQTNSFVTNTGSGVMTHELAHQWFGDKVTCKSWQDIWLNEGFATWVADMFYTEKVDTANYKPYVLSDLANIVSQPGGSVWVNDTTDVNRIFDGRLSYDKGGFLVRMLRWTLGDSSFFTGINNYLTDAKLAYGFANTTDLRLKLEQASGKALTYFFNQWFYGEGYPSFTVKWKDSSNHKLYFSVSQTTSMPSSVSFFKVLLPIQLSNGSQTKVIKLNCTQNNQQFVIANPGFVVTNVAIDPNNYLISNNNSVIRQNSLQFVTSAKVTVSPNPVINDASVLLENMQGKIQLQLFNNTGAIVWSKQMNISQRSEHVQIPFAMLTNGIYKLLATGENHIQLFSTIVK